MLAKGLPLRSIFFIYLIPEKVFQDHFGPWNDVMQYSSLSYTTFQDSIILLINAGDTQFKFEKNEQFLHHVLINQCVSRVKDSEWLFIRDKERFILLSTSLIARYGSKVTFWNIKTFRFTIYQQKCISLNLSGKSRGSLISLTSTINFLEKVIQNSFYVQFSFLNIFTSIFPR